MLKVKSEFAETIFREHEKPLLRFLMTILRNRQDAEEISQEVFLKVLEGPEPEEIRNPKAFIYRTANNLALNKIRYRKVRQIESEGSPDNDPVSRRLGQDRVLESRQELSKLLRIVTGLPPRCREVFILHRFYDLTYRQVARRMGISKSMVKKHMSRAVSHCVRAMEEQP